VELAESLGFEAANLAVGDDQEVSTAAGYVPWPVSPPQLEGPIRGVHPPTMRQVPSSSDGTETGMDSKVNRQRGSANRVVAGDAPRPRMAVGRGEPRRSSILTQVHGKDRETWPPVIPDAWIVGPKRPDEMEFHQIDLAIRGRIGLPQYLLADGVVATLFSRKILFDEPAGCAPEVVDRVRQVLPNVDLSVRVGDLVDDLESAERWDASARISRPMAIMTA